MCFYFQDFLLRIVHCQKLFGQKIKIIINFIFSNKTLLIIISFEKIEKMHLGLPL